MYVFGYWQVALVAADFFSGSYLPSLKAVLPANSSSRDASAAAASAMVRSAILLQHSPLLQPLVEALVLRTQVGGWGGYTSGFKYGFKCLNSNCAVAC